MLEAGKIKFGLIGYKGPLTSPQGPDLAQQLFTILNKNFGYIINFIENVFSSFTFFLKYKLSQISS